MYNGVLNIYKPKGFTSHDIVNKTRKIAGMKKVGHTGTLDPMAEGVLPLCLGKATRIAEYLTGEDKEYIAEITLGIATDTLDAEGEVIQECCVPELSEEIISKTINNFVGKLIQIPPIYSAIKKDGKPLYKYARAGEEMDIPGRKIEIYYIKLNSFHENKINIKVGCSKGTYIRSLARDIGEDLGSCAHLTMLLRTKSGKFIEEESVTLEKLKEEGVEKHIISIDEAIPEFDSLKLNKDDSKKASLGNLIYLDINEYSKMEDSNNVKIFAHDGSLIGIGTLESMLLRPKKVFV